MSRANRQKRFKRVLPYGVRFQKERGGKISREEFELLATEHFDLSVCLKDGGAEALHQLKQSHEAVETFRRVGGRKREP